MKFHPLTYFQLDQTTIKRNEQARPFQKFQCPQRGNKKEREMEYEELNFGKPQVDRTRSGNRRPNLNSISVHPKNTPDTRENTKKNSCSLLHALFPPVHAESHVTAVVLPSRHKDLHWISRRRSYGSHSLWKCLDLVLRLLFFCI